MSRRSQAVQFQPGGTSTAVGGFDATVKDGDPTDPTPRSRGLSRLPSLEPLSGPKPARRNRTAAKATKRRASR
jgi:hypothetical protein